MSTKEELILENELLRKKLAIAGDWMKKEVAQHKKSLREVESKKSGRAKLDNMLERESVDIITRKIRDYFGDSLELAPKFTLNHLIDAEIYWQTLQKFPTLDALPVVISYQKVLECYFESIIFGFNEFEKIKNRNGQSYPGISKPSRGGFDGDIENVLRKKYSLSLGRWYQFFEKVRSGSAFGGIYEDMFLQYMSEKHEQLLEICITDPFYTLFSELINLEVFGKKRHDNKVTFSDAKKVREVSIGKDRSKSLLKLLFDTIRRE